MTWKEHNSFTTNHLRFIGANIQFTFVLQRQRSFVRFRRAYIQLLLFVRSSGFTFACIQQLEYSWNFFGIGPNYITLSDGSDMKHFAGN